MRQPKTPSFLVPGIIALGVVGLVSFLFWKREPNDAALVQQFNRNRAAFVELNAMLATNSPVDPLSETISVWSMEHYQRYRALLRQARIVEVFRDGNEVRFQIAGPRATAKGRRIAVTWTENDPDPVIASVDAFRKEPGQTDHAYRALGEGWFLRVTH